MCNKKIFYKITSAILSIIFVFSLSSCTATNNTTKNEFKNKKIALVFPVSTLDFVDELTFSRWESIQEKIRNKLKDNFQEQNIFISSSASLSEQGNKIKNFVDINNIDFLCYAPNLPTINNKNELKSSALESESAKTEYSELNKNLNYAKKKNVFIAQWKYYKNNFLNDISINLKNDEEIGRTQAQFLVSSLNLNDPNTQTKNIEIFMSNGKLDLDNELLFRGFFSILQPYFETNKIQCCSKTFDKTSTYEKIKDKILMASGDSEAIDSIKKILNTNYVEKNIKLDAVLATDDFIARATTEVLSTQGFFNDILKQANETLSLSKSDDFFPDITGYGTNKINVENVTKNKQNMTIFYDTNALVDSLVDSIFKYVNNKNDKDIKTNIEVDAKIITPKNIKSELIDKNYISPADAGL